MECSRCLSMQSGMRTRRVTTRSSTLLTKATKRSAGPRTSIELFNQNEKDFKQIRNSDAGGEQPKLLTRYVHTRMEAFRRREREREREREMRFGKRKKEKLFL